MFLPLPDAALDGYNTTIFAYGQTSSGKTHSMLGSADDPGVTRRSIQEVFKLVEQTKERQFLLRASYIEIYQEVIRDLLEPSHDNLKIHEDLNRRVYVESREEVVCSVEEVMRMISDGESVRAVGETNMNDRSSRSHTIFTLLIESRAVRPSDVDGALRDTDSEEEPGDDGIAVRASTLSLVDLAGSERATLTGAEGIRLKEGSHINKSLLTLGNVINKLSSSELGGNTAHIPYRDSKLTRILQPALGGNARTAILCAVTPAVMHMEETLSTLKFASRAKKVKNRTLCNEYLDDTAKLRRCERQLVELRKQLIAAQNVGGTGDVKGQVSEEALEMAEKKRIAAFQKVFERFSTFETPSSTSTTPTPKPVASSSSARDALDLAYLPRGQGGCVSPADGPIDPATEATIASMRKAVFAAEQAKCQMFAEIEYERKAMAAEVDTLAVAAEEANKCRAAAEDECSEAISALGHAHAVSLVDEFISTAVVIAESKHGLLKAEARIKELGDVQLQANQVKKKLSSVENDLSEARKREKRGVGPVLKEVTALKAKLQETDSKLRSMKQMSSKTSSEKAALEKEIMGKSRQIKVLDAEVQKLRKHDGMAQARTEKEVSAVQKNLAEMKSDMEATIRGLTSRVTTSDTNLIAEKELRDKLSLDLKDKEGERKKLRERLEETETALSREGDNCAKLKSEVESLSETSSSLKAEVVRLGDELCSNLKILDALQDDTGSLSKEAEQTAEKAAMYAELMEERLKQSDRVLADREAELSRAKADADSLGGELAAVHLGADETRAELALISDKLTRQTEELEGASHSLEFAKKAAQSQEEVAKESAERASTLESNLKKTLEQLESAESNLAKAEDGIKDKSREVAGLREEAASAAKTASHNLGEVSARLETARKDSEEAANRVKELSERVKELESSECLECSKLSESIVEMRHVHASAGDEMKRMQGEVRSAREELASENSRLAAELAKESKKSVSLLETVYGRDERVADLEGKLAEYRRSGGAIRRLEQKVARRDATVEQLRSVLDAQKAVIEDGGYGQEGDLAERAAAAETEISSLKEEAKRQAELVARLEVREAAGQVERRKLRQEIKARELARERGRSDRLQGALQERVENN